MSLTYSEVLKSPYWQRKRLEIMKRDNFTCQFCSDHTSTLNVHHTIYLPGKMPWEYTDDQLITLCEKCHADEEQLKDEDKYIVGQFVMGGLSRRSLFALATEMRRYFSDTTLRNEKFQRLMNWLHE